MTMPTWNTALFGCLIADETRFASQMRTQLSGSLPVPFVSRKADTSAPVEVSFGIEVTDAAFRAWQQWFTYDLIDGSLPFTMQLPWGDETPTVRCRFIKAWQAQRLLWDRWQIGGVIEIERESLPRFSGGALDDA